MSGLKGPKVKIDLGLDHKTTPPKPLVDTGPSLKEMFEKGLWKDPAKSFPYYLFLDEAKGPSLDAYATLKALDGHTLAQMEYLKSLTYERPKPVESASPTCDLGGGLTISLGFRVISASIQGPYYGLRYGPPHEGMLIVTFETPCRDTGKLLTLDFREPLPPGYNEMSPTDKAMWVKNTLRILCMHEVCEGIKVDGVRIFDPHLYPEAGK